MKRNTTWVLGSVLVLAVVASACDTTSPAQQSTSPARSESTPVDNATPDPPETDKPKTTARVDLEKPTFSDPTALTNPLFAMNDVNQMIQLGAEGPDGLRFEVTLLPRTKTIEWEGQQVETRVHQFVAYSNGRILEVAVDFYAQADDGSVWYFGEDVDNYKAGVVADHEGTWLAGRDGPPGMIMPADPRIGNVYRPENIPGLVFEEVTVKSIDETVGGPKGPVSGAVFIQERLQDGTLENKIFAPGYGEFQAEVKTEDEFYGVAVAVPTDALQRALPQELSTLATGADRIFGTAERAAGTSVTKTYDAMTAAWDSYRTTDVPSRLEAQMTDALDALREAVDRGAKSEVAQAALDAHRATLDIQLRYLPPADIDLPRMDIWAQQLRLDAGARRPSAVVGDVAVLETIWYRVRHAADPNTARDISRILAELRTAANAADRTTAAHVATDLQQNLTRLGC